MPKSYTQLEGELSTVFVDNFFTVIVVGFR